MNSKVALGCLLVLAAFFAGCSSNKEMRDRFSKGTRIFSDEDGRKYFVRHNLGDTYFIEPYTP